MKPVVIAILSQVSHGPQISANSSNLYDRSDLGVKLQQDTSKLLHLSHVSHFRALELEVTVTQSDSDLLWRHNREVIHHNYVVHRKVKFLQFKHASAKRYHLEKIICLCERNVVIVILVTIVSSHVPGRCIFQSVNKRCYLFFHAYMTHANQNSGIH